MRHTCLFIFALTIATACAAQQAQPPAGDARTVDSRKGQTCGAGHPNCGEKEVCEVPAGSCEKSDVTGTCVARPENCTQEYAPVCGCDGTTYSNDCMRLMAGARKKGSGECPAKPAELEKR